MLLGDANSGVDDLGLEDVFLVTWACLVEPEDDDQASFVVVVLDCVLENVEQDQLVVLPVSVQNQVVGLIDVAHEHVQVAALDLGHKRKQDLLDVFFNTLDRQVFLDELLLPDFHAHQLAQVVVVHHLA